MAALVSGYVESHTNEPMLKVVSGQIPLAAKVVGEVPEVPAPSWWGLYQAHLKQAERRRKRGYREPARWEPLASREAKDRWRQDVRWQRDMPQQVRSPRWSIWEDADA